MKTKQNNTAITIEHLEAVRRALAEKRGEKYESPVAAAEKIVETAREEEKAKVEIVEAEERITETRASVVKIGNGGRTTTKTSNIVPKILQNAVVRQSYDEKGKVIRLEIEGKIVEIDLNLAKTEIKKLGFWDKVVSEIQIVKRYFSKTGKQIVLGEYNKGERTLFGTLGEIATSLAGVDFPMDIRDLIKSIEDKNVNKAILYAVALLPVIGMVKVFAKTGKLAPEIGTKLNKLADEVLDGFNISLGRNGSFATAEGYTIKISDNPNFAKKVGSGGGTGQLTKNGNPYQFRIDTTRGTKVTDFVDKIEITTVNKLKSKITISKDSKVLDIQNVFRGNVNYNDVSMSSLILDQIDFVGKNPQNLKQIKLPTVINTDFLKAMTEKGKDGVIKDFGNNSSLDGMVRKILKKLGKEIDNIQISDFLPDDAILNKPDRYNIIINLK